MIAKRDISTEVRIIYHCDVYRGFQVERMFNLCEFMYHRKKVLMSRYTPVR